MSELFDTNILIDHLNGIGQATEEIRTSADPAISVITWIEVMTGADGPTQEKALRAFLTNFQSLPLTDTVAARAAELRRTLKIKLPDAVILATAQTAHRELVTRNARDFPPEKSRVRVPYKV